MTAERVRTLSTWAAGGIVLTDRGRLRSDGGSDGQPVQRIGVMRVAGYSDPLEWRGGDPGDPDRVFSFSEQPDGERAYARAVQRLQRWFDRLAPRPQVVLVHQNGLAQRLARHLQSRGDAGELVILTGHDHEQHVDRYGDILVVDAGTVGAGGVFGVGAESVGVAQLHTATGEGRPRAIDLIQIEPLSGASRAERIIPSSPRACEQENIVRCHEEPGSPGSE